jgi:hypothetical protein
MRRVLGSHIYFSTNQEQERKHIAKENGFGAALHLLFNQSEKST